MKRKRLTRLESQEQTRQTLLDSAVAVFTEKGFALASVEEIAERAGYSKGAVYSNFSSKEDLALTVLERQAEQQLEAFKLLLPTQGDDPSFWVQQGQTGSHGPWEMLIMELSVRAVYNAELRARIAAYHQRIMDEAAQILAGENAPTAQQRDAVIATTALASGLAMRYLVIPDEHLFEIWGKVVALLFQETQQ